MTRPWFSDEDHLSMRHIEHEFATLAATVDQDDPWAHPRADRTGQHADDGLAGQHRCDAERAPCSRRASWA